MKAGRFGSLLMLLAVICISCGAAAAQRRNIDKWERRELRADRHEIRADNRSYAEIVVTFAATS